MKKKESTKKRFFEGSALGSALRMTKSKGLMAIVISLLFALVLSACSVAAIDSNKPIAGSVDVTSETKEATLSYSTSNLVLTNTYNFAYTGAQQTLSGGFKSGYVYKLEVWGAQGGGNRGNGGQGGYSMGYFYSSTNAVANVSVYVGGRGVQCLATTSNVAAGGYNGGGRGIDNDRADATWGWYNTGSGGGATDIRTAGTDYSNRIIVAGGGGAATWQNGTTATLRAGGAGGGSTGGNGVGDASTTGGSGGSQTARGAAGSAAASHSGGESGFPTGGVTSPSYWNWGAGGGGGYWGGGAGGVRGGNLTSAGGGSGYIGGVDSLSNSVAVNQQGGWTGNGKAVITEYALFTLKSPSYLNKERLTSFSIPKLDVANEATSTTTALTFNNTTNLYLDNAGTQAATDYFTVTGTADNLTVTPKVSIESRTFYAYMKSNTGALVYAPITISTKNDLMIMKS